MDQSFRRVVALLLFLAAPSLGAATRLSFEDLLANLTQGQTLEEVFLWAIAQEEPPSGEPHRSEPSHGVEEADL